jgi:hypothetical protein
MKWISWFGATLLATAVVGGVAFGAYQAGRHRSDESPRVVRVESPATTQDGQSVAVVHAVEPGVGHHWGFFPGFFFFPLFFFLLVFCVFRGGFGRGPWRRGTWNADEWHRRQHESDGQPVG